MNQWWGYVHIEGSLHIKRYFSMGDLYDAQESPFVKKIYDPFYANSAEEAEKILIAQRAKELLS